MAIWNRERDMIFHYRRKNRWKAVRTVVQAVVLVTVGVLVYQAVFNTSVYSEPNESQWTSDKGFVALSYFGVGRTGTPKLIAKSLLNQQLKALYDQGYRTISQQDVLDYYKKGRPLPAKALFLSFEDGRNDSALFAEPLLEKYNDKATFLSYASKLGNGENKFTQAKDMLKMQKSGYWELGSNGYRLSYINVFDRTGQFAGQMTEGQMKNKSKISYYNHYLMDFIRDENMIPSEDRKQMEARVTKDYTLMKDVYTNKLGFVPGLYMIMHANSLQDGNNQLVTDVNEKNIEALFSMHFAREGDAFNSKDSNVYNLTRLQPQPYWSTNHLLMKLQKDTGQVMTFVVGSKDRASDWETITGAAEFDENQIVLTSPSGGSGLAYLKGSDNLGDMSLTAKLSGNVVGKQSLYVRYDKALDAYVRVVLADNEIAVEQKKPGQAAEQLFKAKLGDATWAEEDLSYNKAAVYTQVQTQHGVTEDTGIPVNMKQTRSIDVELADGKLSLKVDGKMLVNKRAIDASLAKGGVALGSEASTRNAKDDIYDGRFTDVTVKTVDQNGKLQPFYHDINEGLQGAIIAVKHGVNRTVDWFIDTF